MPPTILKSKPTHQMKKVKLLILAVISLGVVSCAGPNANMGAALGGLGGAAVGGIIGHQSGRGLEGAAIGGATGAVAGGLIGNSQDQRNRERAYYENQQQQQYQNQGYRY